MRRYGSPTRTVHITFCDPAEYWRLVQIAKELNLDSIAWPMQLLQLVLENYKEGKVCFAGRMPS